MLTRVSGVCGIASPLVGLTVISVAVASSPWFSWTENDLSVLGVEGSTTLLFNRGLILAGLLSLIFAIGLRKNLLSSRPGQLGVVSLLLGSVALSAAGIFPRTINLPHDAASIAFFVFIALGLLLVGVAAIAASKMTRGVLSVIAGAFVIALLKAPWPWSGGAIEQFLACIPWSLWTMAVGVRLLMRASLIDV